MSPASGPQPISDTYVFNAPGLVHTESVNSCLKPIGTLDGCAITTSEGLGNSSKGFSVVQGASPHQTLCHRAVCSKHTSAQQLLQTLKGPLWVSLPTHIMGSGYWLALSGCRPACLCQLTAPTFCPFAADRFAEFSASQVGTAYEQLQFGSWAVALD